MKLLIVHPGASWSTSDVYDGLTFGLEHHGVQLVRYRLDSRIGFFSRFMKNAYKRAKKHDANVEKPTEADILFRAGVEALERALYHAVDAVVVVSGMFLHPDVLIMMKRAGLKVFVLFTESPYDIEKELPIAKLVDGCWTNERASVDAFRAVNPRSGYLPHGWHPERHYPSAPMPEGLEVASHDVVFVGSGFTERIKWFNSIDWSGIDLGLYGTWSGLGLKPALKSAIKGKNVDNRVAAALYRKAKVGLNLYRVYKRIDVTKLPERVVGESLSPRAYELAALGCFHISDYRPEVAEVFGHLVPTFRTPAEAETLMRTWLAADAGRADVASRLPACVAEATWVERATRVIGDLQTVLGAPGATGDEKSLTHVSVSREESGSVPVDEPGWRGDGDGQPHGLDAR